MGKLSEELDDLILECWHREFDPTKNPPMPVTLFEDFKTLIQTEKRKELEAVKNEIYKRNDGLISIGSPLTYRQFGVLDDIIEARIKELSGDSNGNV